MLLKYKSKLLLPIICIGCIGLILSIFPLTTLISLGILLLGLYLYVYENFKNFKKKGFINRLPPKLKSTLYQRSIFDILCDMWYLPKMSLYFKVLLRPFIYQITPEEAIQNLEELPQNVKKAILTKGVINILPHKLKDFLFNEQQEESNGNIQPVQLLNNNQDTLNLHEFTQNGVSQLYAEYIDQKSESEQDQEEQEEENNSQSEELSVKSCGEINHQSSNKNQVKQFIQTEDEIDTNIQSNESSSKFKQEHSKIKKIMLLPLKKLNIFRKNPIIKFQKKRKFQSSNLSNQQFSESAIVPSNQQTQSNLPKTQILYSSNTLFQNNKSTKLSAMWDKLELFKQKISEKQLNNQNKYIPKTNLIGPLQIINQVINFTQNGFISRIDSKKITKISIGSTLLFLIQVAASSRVRSWCSHTVKLIIYLITIFTASMSTGLLALKYLKQRKGYLKNN